MFCIKCGHKETQVTNSRGHKKTAEVWRRRHCVVCGNTITTIEKPTLGKAIRVYSPRLNKSTPFSLGKLVHSISHSFTHDESLGIDSSVWLAETVVAKLAPAPDGIVTTISICQQTYDTLSHFDTTAAAQYGLRHGLINTTKLRRKRVL